jgi:hypothetical protein
MRSNCVQNDNRNEQVKEVAIPIRWNQWTHLFSVSSHASFSEETLSDPSSLPAFVPIYLSCANFSLYMAFYLDNSYSRE